MFCPKCRSEFEGGYTRCDACDADLVETLPVDEEEYTDLVTVFEGDDETAAVIRAKLESVGIEAWIQGEAAHGVFPNLSPAAVQVRAEDSVAACQALEDVVALGEDAVIDDTVNDSADDLENEA
jgi:hypothetical protein